MSPESHLMQLYGQLLGHYGPQQWWPADTVEEIIIGAVLTQNTAWANVEKAISNLRQAGSLDTQTIQAMPVARLAELIRPSGYYNIKAKRLQALSLWVVEQGGIETLKQWPTDRLRPALLEVYGVGPETADDIILYAFNRPVFVIDAYTRRLFSRYGITHEEDYETLRSFCESNLKADVQMFADYHALIVIHAKEACRTKPLCHECALDKDCAYISK